MAVTLAVVIKKKARKKSADRSGALSPSVN